MAPIKGKIKKAIAKLRTLLSKKVEITKANNGIIVKDSEMTYVYNDTHQLSRNLQDHIQREINRMPVNGTLKIEVKISTTDEEKKDPFCDSAPKTALGCTANR